MPLKSQDAKEIPVPLPSSPVAASLPSVSVLIPVRNGEATIGEAIDSVLSQDYEGSVEIIVADGSDTAATADLVRRLYPTVKLVPNPEQIITHGIHAAHRASTGEIIVRCDAHTVLPSGYLRRAVSTLQRTGAANVGGRQRPIGTTFFERAVAVAMTTPLGTGGARYRLGGTEGPVDTVFLGVFRRDSLEAAGGVDPTLGGAEDYELNWRLRARGETVWFDPELAVAYRPRGTLRGLARQYFNYGRWKRVVARRHPFSLLPRHLASPLLLLGLAVSLITAMVVVGASLITAAVPLLYVLTLVLGSLTIGVRRGSSVALLLPLVLATMHLSWGIGFFVPVRTKRALTVSRLPSRDAAALPSVSVLIPARNAEATIGAAIDSVLSQDYKGSVEVIVADGSDSTATSELVQRRYPTVKLVPNPQQTAGFGLRAAHAAATGEIIARCDAHAVFPEGYLRRAVSTLQRTGAANVGGRQRPLGTTFFGRAVAIAMTTPLGAGGARYRLGGAEGPVDTVFLGAFRRNALEAAGGVDPAFVRNQDYELNWRLRSRGETVWFDPELAVAYQPRGNLRDLAWQYFNYGRWKRIVARRHPASLLPRHLASPLLLLGLAVSLAMAVPSGSWAAAAVPLAYVLALVLGSLAIGIHRRSSAALLLPLVLAVMHLSWGAGFFTPLRFGSSETVASVRAAVGRFPRSRLRSGKENRTGRSIL